MGTPQAGNATAKTPCEIKIVRIVDEYLQRLKAGEADVAEELLAAHPELASELRPHFELARQLSITNSPIQDLLQRGILAPSDDESYAGLLGVYRVVRVVGQGGMGIVLEAYDAALHRQVAIKVLRPELITEPAILTRFEREARAVAALEHPHIVRIHAVNYARGVPYIVMEYIPGTDLASRLRRDGPLPTTVVRRFFGELLSALAAAHDSGVVHRDVKSSNILLAEASDAERALLADFGLAQMRDAQTRLTITAAVMGTPAYMSPEQARGDAVDARSDLYSAGVVLYEMLTGQTPFRADTPTATLHRILNEPPRDPRKTMSDADPELSRLAMRLLEKHSNDRFASAHDAMAALAHGFRDSRQLRRRVRAVALWLVVVVACSMGAWHGLTRWVPIDDVRRCPDNVQCVEAHRPLMGWLEICRFDREEDVTALLLDDFDGDDRPDIYTGINGPGYSRLEVWSPSGQKRWGTAIPNPRAAGPDGREEVVQVGVGRLYGADVWGVPRGVECFAALNERTGPRAWLCSISPEHDDPSRIVQIWGHEPFGHIQHLALAHRPLENTDDSYSVLSWTMANLWSTTYLAEDAQGNQTPFCRLDWDCVPSVSLHRPKRGTRHHPEHSILFDLPVRVEARARCHPESALIQIGSWSFAHGDIAGYEAPLVIQELSFEGDQDLGPDSRISVVLGHLDQKSVSGRWRVTFDGRLELLSCEPIEAPANSVWTADAIAARWRRVIESP